MGSRLGVGFIGTGFITNFHIRSWQGVRDADIVALVGRTPERAQATAENCRRCRVGDPTVYATISEMVADPRVDAIWVCGPNYLRVPMIEEIAATIKSGKGKLRGIAIEKPLARNVREAERVVELIKETGILHGYLEDQCFSPTVVRGRDILWRRGAALAGPPYLARCAEEHSGPHEPWFWMGKTGGGGVLNDMLCHSVEVARLLLRDPSKPKDSLKPVAVSAEIGCLKWSRPEYAAILSQRSGGQVDYIRHPAEDYARATVTFQGDDGRIAAGEVTTSWCFVGAGLRLTYEVMGPEYSLNSSSLNSELSVFFSRNVKGEAGEDLVEKQNAEQGLMPVVPAEEVIYGYTDQNRHMVQAFLDGRQPAEDLEDGLLVTKLLMTAYMSAEQGRKLDFAPAGLTDFVPAVARGDWQPGQLAQGHKV